MAAGLGYKEFTTGDVLTAADANGYLASQVVMVFADAAARTAAITSPQEGMVSYLKDTNATEYYTGSAWTSIAGASGGMTLLSTTSLTGSTTTVGSISGSYTNLVVYLKDFYAGDAAQVFLNFNTDTTNANYQWSAMRGYASGADFQFAANARCIATTLKNTQADNFMVFEIPNYANTTTHKTYLAYGKVLNSVTTVVNNVLNATYIGGTSAISSISFVTDVGTWQAGTIEIYGVK
jgi:hypothetical protein